jgi:hypothetical protein
MEIWLWAATNAPDGVIRGISSAGILRGESGESPEISAIDAIESVAGWNGPPGKLANCLFSLRLIDKVDDGLAIHDWEDHASAFAEKSLRESNDRARKKAAYWAKKGLSPPAYDARKKTASILRGESADTPRVSSIEIEGEIEGEYGYRSPGGARSLAPATRAVGPWLPMNLPGESPEKAENPSTRPCLESKRSPGESPEKAESPSTHQAIFDCWARLWRELRTDEPYLFSGAKDGASVRRLLAVPGATPAEIEARMKRAFADSWFRNHGTLSVFCSQWSQWAIPKNANGSFGPEPCPPFGVHKTGPVPMT